MSITELKIDKSTKKSDFNVEQVHELYQRRVDTENTLIHKRSTAFLAMQGILIAPMSLIAGDALGKLFVALTAIFGMIGILSAILTWISVRAAQIVIFDLKTEFEEKTREINTDHLPPLAGGASTRPFLLRGGMSSIFLPVTIAFAWVFIVLAVFYIPSSFEELIENANEAVINSIVEGDAPPP